MGDDGKVVEAKRDINRKEKEVVWREDIPTVVYD